MKWMKHLSKCMKCSTGKAVAARRVSHRQPCSRAGVQAMIYIRPLSRVHVIVSGSTLPEIDSLPATVYYVQLLVMLYEQNIMASSNLFACFRGKRSREVATAPCPSFDFAFLHVARNRFSSPAPEYRNATWLICNLNLYDYWIAIHKVISTSSNR